MALSNADILNAIKQKPVMELVDLIEAFEKEFNVSAAAVAVAAGPAAGGGAAAAAEEQTEFTAVLKDFGAKKVEVIKVVREITGLGLKEAKELSESTPKELKASAPKAEAESIKKKIEEAGGKVTDIWGNDQRYDGRVRGALLSNGILHQQILDLLKPHLAEQTG